MHFLVKRGKGPVTGRARRGLVSRRPNAFLAVPALVALGLAALVSLPTVRARADDDGVSTASLRPADTTEPTASLILPHVLSDHDARLYREIFRVQEKAEWHTADRLIRQLHDKVLMGHVLAQRYLHPTGYRSHFRELRDWLRHYADLPEARQIYKLALRRRPRHAAWPRPPRARFPVSAANIAPDAVDPPPVRHETRGERHVYRHVAWLVHRIRLTEAGRYLDEASVQRAAGRAGVDRARALVAAGWFRYGKTRRAYDIAHKAARRSGGRAPKALWWAGLAAFRMGHYGDAMRFFAEMAKAHGIDDREQAAAAFWAGRSALRGGHMAEVGPFLDRAAKMDRTFYGEIAARIRGIGPTFDWSLPDVTDADIASFSEIKAGRRVLALVQIGQMQRAGEELRALRVGAAPRLLHTVIALTDATDLPGASLRAGRVLMGTTGQEVDAALYPVPRWTPEGGYQIDRALVFALARQESGFNTHARSHSGARGLLQLMPATARFMADNRHSFRGRSRAKLYNPRLNLTLGQKYVDHLLNGDVVSGNLVLMIAAYNGGPGNLAKWQRDVSHGSDPLVFIEAIPVRETRLFVHRVFENLWAYRARLHQDQPSLDALASGHWPVYVGLDNGNIGVAEKR